MKLPVSLLFTFVCTLLCISTVRSQKLVHRQGEILVQLDKNVSGNKIGSLLNQVGKKSPIPFEVHKRVSDILNIYLLNYDFRQYTFESIASRLYSLEEVLVVQPNRIIQVRQNIPNDPDYSIQWYFNNTGNNNGVFDADIDAPEAWTISTGNNTGGDPIVIAVLDDGTNVDLPDLLENRWKNRAEIPGNGIDDDQNGYVDDFHGWNLDKGNDDVSGNSHGQEVEAIIGARGNNNQGLSGLCWDVQIMSITVESVSDEAEAIAAYEYALKQRILYNQSNGQDGAFVVATNASWGIDEAWGQDYPLWCSYYDTLGLHGIINFAATTNDNVDVEVVGDMPSTCNSDHLIMVSQTDNRDQPRSGFGPRYVDLSAPGVRIPTYALNQNIINVSGTSYATPLATGITGLLYNAPCTRLRSLAQSDPGAAALSVRRLLFEGVDTLVALVDRVGAQGRINAAKSLEILMEECGNCLPPISLEGVAIGRESAELTWVSSEPGAQIELRWRRVGELNWMEIQSASSPFLLTDLDRCGEYEWQVRSRCGTTVSDYSPIQLLITEGCCDPPLGMELVSAGNDFLEIAWQGGSMGDYTLRYRVSGTQDWLEVSADDRTKTLNNLFVCTDYEIALGVQCDTLNSGFTPSVVFTTLGCGACLDLDYCESAASNRVSEFIHTFEIGSYVQNEGVGSGYQFYSSTGISLQAGRSYPIRLVPGFDQDMFSEVFRIWVDLDQDGIFSDQELRYTSEPSTTEQNGWLGIPIWSSNGNTRMRISMRSDILPQPCGGFSFGEVEDYCVAIAGGKDCPPPHLRLFNQDTQVLMESNSSQPLLYRYRPQYTQAWREVTVSGSQILNFEDLVDCTIYEVQAATLCDASVQRLVGFFIFQNPKLWCL